MNKFAISPQSIRPQSAVITRDFFHVKTADCGLENRRPFHLQIYEKIDYTMTITIRHTTETDISLLAYISKQTFYEAFHDNNSSQENFNKYLAEAFTKDKVRSEFELPTSLFLLAENESGKTVAYAKLRWDSRRDDLMPSANYIEVERIYVLKKYWRMGIGKLMMEKVYDLARRREYEYVCLSVYEENAPAIRFYERLDFQKVGTVAFELGDVVENDILMCIDL